MFFENYGLTNSNRRFHQ